MLTYYAVAGEEDITVCQKKCSTPALMMPIDIVWQNWFAGIKPQMLCLKIELFDTFNTFIITTAYCISHLSSILTNNLNLKAFIWYDDIVLFHTPPSFVFIFSWTDSVYTIWKLTLYGQYIFWQKNITRPSGEVD